MMFRFLGVISRIISRGVALAITIGIVVFPRVIAADMYAIPHVWLIGLLFGMSAAYVHGFGFIPKNTVLKVIFSPAVAWPLIAFSSYQIFV